MVNAEVLLRGSDVQAEVSLSRSAVYERMNPKSPRYDSSFPQPIRVGAVAVRWLKTEIDAWVATRPRARVIAANDGELVEQFTSVTESSSKINKGRAHG